MTDPHLRERGAAAPPRPCNDYVKAVRHGWNCSTVNLREPSGILYEDPVSLDQLVTVLTSAGISTALRRIENGTTVRQAMAAHGRARLIHRPSGPTPYVPIAQNWMTILHSYLHAAATTSVAVETDLNALAK
jgi:hypothetical protein